MLAPALPPPTCTLGSLLGSHDLRFSAACCAACCCRSLTIRTRLWPEQRAPGGSRLTFWPGRQAEGGAQRSAGAGGRSGPAPRRLRNG